VVGRATTAAGERNECVENRARIERGPRIPLAEDALQLAHQVFRVAR